MQIVFHKKSNLRLPGIEPGPTPWKGAILPLDYRRYFLLRNFYFSIFQVKVILGGVVCLCLLFCTWNPHAKHNLSVTVTAVVVL